MRWNFVRSQTMLTQLYDGVEVSPPIDDIAHDALIADKAVD